LKDALKARRQVYFHELGGFIECPTHDRSKLGVGDRLPGPAVVEEWASTTIVNPSQQLQVGSYGELVIAGL
jgi:N-methylhydantoinase A